MPANILPRIIPGLAAALACSLGFTPLALAEAGRKVAPQPRPMERPTPPRRPPAHHGHTPELQTPKEARSIDGVGNNFQNPDWGSAGIAFRRLTKVSYADGVSSPAGPDRPSPREISNAVVAQTESVPNERGASDFLWQWGQFLDHDIDETPALTPAEPFDIAVPSGDPYFDPTGTGTKVIPLNRSFYEKDQAGVRQQINEITAYIDASNVYGSDEARAYALQTLDATGKLQTSAGDMLPYNWAGQPNAPDNSAYFFLAGDVRANEQIGLTCMHTLFVREHNYWAGQILDSRPDLTGEEIYQMARAIVGAEIQAITYREFLPILLGPNALPPYRGYRPSVNAGISNIFATAAFRVGHTLLSEKLLRLDANLNEIDLGHLNLANAFFNPQVAVDSGIEPVLRGLAVQRCQEVDANVIDAVRNFLFGAPGSGGFDLASLNLQRGRDHGLASFNQVRRDFGLRAYFRFRDLGADRETTAALESVYRNVDSIDAWVGMLAERHAPGAMVGPTIRAVLVDQFTRLRDGDRFFYLNTFTPRMTEMIHRQTLATIIRRNTGIGRELQDNVFLVESPRFSRPGQRPR